MADLKLAAEFDEAGREQWLALVDKVLKGADFDRRLVSYSDDGMRIEPLYTRADGLDGVDGAVTGPAGFARGLRAAAMGTGWDIRQLHIETDPRAANKAILEDLSGGVSSICLQMQAPGQVGLPIDPVAMATALQGVDLSICPVALQSGENFGAASAHLLGSWATQKIEVPARRGAFNADPLGTLAVNGGLGQPIEQAVAGASALLARTQDLPLVTAMIADGRPYHAGGASEAQELAVMLATFAAYLRCGETAGLAPRQVFSKIAIGLAAVTDQFLTIAKLRAARLLVGRVAQAVGVGENLARVDMAVTTSWRMLSQRDPWVNMLRTTIACAGAAMGGADAITVLPFTLARGRPDAFARRIARNTQIILQEESALGQVNDPAGGSWYVEKLTDDLARRAWQIFREIEAEGGMAAALQSGFVQRMIAETAEMRARRLACGKQEMTGVSAFARLGDDDVSVDPFDQPAPVDGTGARVAALVIQRLAAPFERLRERADAYEAGTGKLPAVFLANLGAMSDFNGGASWAKNFFAAGGIEALSNDGFTNAADVGAAFAASGAQIACLCSSDQVFSELGEAVASLLKTAGAKAVYVAGRGGAQEAALKAAGVDEFLYAGCDAIAALQSVHEILGEDK